MRIPFAATAVVLLSLLAACGGGGGGKDTPAFGPPSQFTVAEGASFWQVALAWTPAPTAAGYDLEGAVGTGAYSQLNATLIPPTSTGGTIQLDPSMPELTELNFRVRSWSGSIYSDYATASLLHGIAPATSLNPTLDEPSQTLTLTWTRNSLVADSLLLERNLTANQDSGAWAALAPLDPGATSFVDHDLTEGNTYSYRITYAKGGVQSKPAVSAGCLFSLAAPGNVTLTTGTSSVTLTWVDRSTLATSVQIYGCPGFAVPWAGATPLAVLPPTATTYTVTGLSQGYYTYAVVAQSDGGNWQAPSAMVHAILQPPPLDGATLQSSLLQLPSGSHLVDAEGAWLTWPVLQPDQTYSLVTTTATGTLNQKFSSVAYPSSPALILDASSQPHIVYTEEDPTGTFQSLIHGWRDAGVWYSQMVAGGASLYLGPSGQASIPILMAPDGTLHVLYMAAGSAPQGNQVFDASVGWPGTWTRTADPQLASLGWFTVDPTGSLLGLQLVRPPGGQTSTLALWTRAQDGTWSSETVPGLAFPFGGDSGPSSLQAGADGTIHLLLYGADPVTGNLDTLYMAKANGVWSQPVTVATNLTGPFETSLALAVSPVDQRLFFAADLAAGLTLFTKGPGGAWESATLLAASDEPFSWEQGLDAQGRFWLLGDFGILAPAGYFAAFQEQ